MMQTVADLPAEEDVLLRLDKTHKAMHRENELYEAAREQAINELWAKHAPFIAESQSVYLQVKAEAYRAGFTDDDIAKATRASC